MKSKVYFSRYVKATCRNQMWLPSFIAIGFLIAFPVAELIQLGKWFGIGYNSGQIGELYEHLWQDGLMYTGLAVTVGAAFATAFSQFWYLYSSRKVDFYHCLSVKRSSMFWQKTGTALVYYLVPYLIMEFLVVCIGAMRGFFSLHLMKLAALMMTFHLLLFLLLYFAAVMVICLTGTLLVGALCLAIVLFYGPALAPLLTAYESTFWGTYAGISYGLHDILYSASPLTLAASFADGYAAGSYGGLLFAVVLVMLAELAVSYLAYVKRPSESTGNAFAFSWIGTVVRFLSAVPAGLFVGIVFYQLPMDNSRMVWGCFGLAAGTVLAHGILEVICQMDFHAFFSHKLQLLTVCILAAACAAVFSFDLLGYDRYLPDYDRIGSISIDLDYMKDYVSNVTEEDGYYKTKTIENMNAGFEVGLSADIYSAVEKMQKQTLEILDEIGIGEKNPVSIWQCYDKLKESANVMTVKFHLKSGRDVYREYMADADSLKELLQACYAQGNLKEERFSVLGIDEKYLTEIHASFCNGLDYVLFQDNSAKRSQFLQAFCEDVKEASPEVLTGEPIAAVSLDFGKVPKKNTIDNMVPGGVRYDYYSSTFYVFPEYTRTIAILEEEGYPMSMEEVEIDRVEVKYYMDEDASEESNVIAYDSSEELAQLKKVLRSSSLLASWEEPASRMAWSSLEVYIDGEEIAYWSILADEVPKFMEEDALRALAFEVYE